MESVIALFPEPAQAQRALETLQARGFECKHLTFATTNAVGENDLAQTTGISPEAGAPAGSAATISGMLWGALAGIGLVFPVWVILLLDPLSRIYAHGGVLAMLFGAIGGLALGGMFGALMGSDQGDYVKLLRKMGVPVAQAERFNAGLKDGNILVIARDPQASRADEALKIMRQNGAIKLDEAQGKGQLHSERGR